MEKNIGSLNENNDDKDINDEKNVEIVEEEEESETDDKIGELPVTNKFYSGNIYHLKTEDDKANIAYPKDNIKFCPVDFQEFFPIIHRINDKVPIYHNECTKGPSFFCIHGAGHSGVSFSMFGKTMLNNYSVFSFDIAGHGYNTDTDGNMSKSSLINQCIQALDHIVNMDNFKKHNFIIVGHSMGGSIATFLVEYIQENKDKHPKLEKAIKGLIVIDVSEGSAKEALPFMENVVKTRPKYYHSLEDAVEYCFKNNIIQSLQSAKVSIPPLFKHINGNYYWKVDLMESKKYWNEWFENLTKVFLKVSIPKELVMAGPERMDKELTIGHMQGKFKLVNYNNVGHFVHEDNVKAFSDSAKEFVKIFKVCEFSE